MGDHEEDRTLIRFGDDVHEYALDPHTYTLFRPNKPPLELQTKVFDVLYYLVKHHDRYVRTQELSGKFWRDQDFSDSALERTMTNVRQSIGDERFIQTRRNVGYRFIGDVRMDVDPAASPSPNTTRQENDKSRSLKHATILVVDDEPAVLDLLFDTLSLQGFQVLKATDGLEAIDIAWDKRPELVLLDIHLRSDERDPNGFSVLRKMKEKAPDIPVILMSGKYKDIDALADTAVKSVSSGAVDFLPKPSTVDAIVGKVIKHLLNAKTT